MYAFIDLTINYLAKTDTENENRDSDMHSIPDLPVCGSSVLAD